jgi:hypothetical protein
MNTSQYGRKENFFQRIFELIWRSPERIFGLALFQPKAYQFLAAFRFLLISWENLRVSSRDPPRTVANVHKRRQMNKVQTEVYAEEMPDYDVNGE